MACSPEPKPVSWYRSSTVWVVVVGMIAMLGVLSGQLAPSNPVAQGAAVIGVAALAWVHAWRRKAQQSEGATDGGVWSALDALEERVGKLPGSKHP